mmetsp:Transcript_55528/g.126222  ORF Transcript_55528/g.126222 Transcript_55528/m.126222 type:complete len:267 (+) Transcript_55528:52-852(+)
MRNVLPFIIAMAGSSVRAFHMLGSIPLRSLQSSILPTSRLKYDLRWGGEYDLRCSRLMSSSVSTGTESSTSKHRVIFILGGPGAGKGTQCAKLVDDFGFTHLSAGDLLREERASGSDNGQLIDEYIREGKIVPVEISLGLLKKRMDVTRLAGRDSTVFLIDGFPRNQDNVQGWTRLMEDETEVLSVLFMDCSQEEQERRLLSRGLTSGRTDDNIESARKRFKTFVDETLPVVNHYDKLGLIRRVPAEKDPESVYEVTRDQVLKSLK